MIFCTFLIRNIKFKKLTKMYKIFCNIKKQEICRKLIKNIDKGKNISAKYRYMFDLSEKKRKL